MSDAANGPLHGVTVLDLTRVVSGPYCTMLLADMGARVIKVEQPGSGDDTRSLPPMNPDGSSAFYEAVNRGKESIALDLKAPPDRAIFERLLERADVLVDNFRPGVMARLGYAAESLAARFPALVQASVTGFGQTGPDRGRQAYDIIIQAMGGIMSMTGAEGGPPARVGTSMVDIGSGMFAAIGILGALFDRAASGRGSRVDVAMLDSIVAMTEHALMRSQLGTPVLRTGSRFPTTAPADSFRTADGWFVMTATRQPVFEALMGALGLPHLCADPRFAAASDRLANHAALKTEIEAVLTTRDTAHWDGVMLAANIPCGPLRSVDDLLGDPQLHHRHMLRPSGEAGGILYPGNPVKISGMDDPAIGPAAPALDSARARILAELGMEDG